MYLFKLVDVLFLLYGSHTILAYLRMGHTIIIIMYIYHALINALSAHMIYIDLNMIFFTHVEHSPTKTIYIKYYTKKKRMHFKHTHTLIHTHTHTHTHAMTVAETGY